MKTILVAYSFGYNKQFGYSGIDRYSQELDEGLVSIGYKHNTYEYSKSVIKRIFSTPKAVKGYDVIHLTQPLGYEAFLNTKAKKILTWHDNMIFTRKSKVQFYNIFRGLMAYSLADIITFNSQQSMNELKDYISKYKFDENKIYDITPLPIDDIWIKQKINKKQKRDKGFIYIGAIHYPHKNFDGLIQTYKNLCNKIDTTHLPPLHIFTSSPNSDELEEQVGGYPYPIFFHTRASDKEILKYLKESIALLHLSTYEGYGLPILESLAVGTPVITLDKAKIPEETKKWTIITDNPVEEALKLYEKPRSASQEAISYAKSLTKENYARKMVKLYMKI
jgi:glycosyltransferase involved in cell wall biosynthesis